MKKKILIAILGSILFYFSIEHLINWTHSLVFGSRNYFTFTGSNLFLTKYILIALAILLFIYVKAVLTPFGKKFLLGTIPLLLLLFIAVFSNYTATNEEGITKFSLISKEFVPWEDVSSVSTKAIVKNDTRNGQQRTELDFDYRLYYGKDKSLNAWDDIESLDALNRFVLKKGISIEHKEVSRDVKEHTALYIKGDKGKIEHLLDF
jgi:hypothetical protein